MLAPGMTFSAAGRVETTIGAATAADFINEGVGFMNNGDLAIDTDAPTGNNWKGGVRINSSGAIYGTTATAGSDVWVEGIRVSADGQLIYEAANPTSFNNGNPVTANGLFAVN